MADHRPGFMPVAIAIGRVTFSEIVRDKMQGAAALKVPLTVDVGVGDNWKDAKE